MTDARAAERGAVPSTHALMVREIEAHLTQIRDDARGNTRRELTGLYLLALEREELATVGYGGADLQARIARLEASQEVHAVVRHALRWAARDERTHAVLARGMLLRTGQLGVALRSFSADLGGLIAGWAAAVLQHTRKGQAPIARLVARLITWFGGVAGKVPESAKDTLREQTFTEFCAFQVGAEETAAIAWERTAEVLRQTGDETLATVATRIGSDERKHVQMLALFLDAFDAHDRLRDGWDRARLAAALFAIDPSFVRAADRAEQHPIGSGGAVHVQESEGAKRAEPEALRALLEATLEASGFWTQLGARIDGGRVAIKTTFMMSYDRRDPSPHVDPWLAAELARLLRERGAVDVTYLESPNQYDEIFAHRSVQKVAQYIGFSSEHFRVADTEADQIPHVFKRGLGQDSIARTWAEADVRLVFAKMRTNPSWLVQLCTQNLESLGRRLEEMLFHDRSADLASGLMMLIDAFPPDFALLDATHHVPDGLTGILGDPAPAHPGRMYAARDPLALDWVAARHMGITRLPQGGALSLALDWFDDPTPHTTVVGVDAPIAPFLSPHRNDFTIFLAALAYPVYVFGGDRGNLWVPVMDRQAFPLLRSESVLEGIARPMLRGVFGFGQPGEEP